MRPPILWISVAFGAGLWTGLDAFQVRGAWYVGAPVLVGAAALHRRAPLGAALGIMAAAGVLWGGAAVRERDDTCAGRWSRERGAGSSKAAIVQLGDPAPASGGLVEADVVPGACGGALGLRWPEGYRAAGGTTWVVAGRWTGFGERGVLVVRRAHQLDPTPRGRGALRGRLAERTTALFGARAPLVDALVFAPNATLDADMRERYARAGLAHILSISGLHVGFLAAWLALVLRRLGLGPPPARAGAAALLLFGYLWLLAFPAPATRAVVMLVTSEVARLRQRVVAPRGVIALSGVVLLLADPWALHSVGAWLSVTAIGAVIWADRATAGSPRALRLVAPALAATLVTAPITALAFGTVAPIGVVANLVAIPLAAVAVPGLVLALVLSWAFAGLAQLLAAGAGLALALLDLIATGAAQVPGGHVVMTAGWQAAALWTGVALAAWWLWNSPRRPWLIAARAAFAFTILLWPSVVDALDAELVLEPGEPLGRPLYLEFLAAVEASDARWHAARAGDRVEVDGVTLEVLSPDSLWMALPLDVNEHGVVLRVTFGAVRLLFQADAGLPVEGRLAGTVGPVELLKVGHHGSRSATSDAWLAELRPREAVISVGRHNHYGHPAPEVLARLARYGITILRTDERGTITFATDGHGARVGSHHD